jgi:hypothetical protein
MPVTLGIYNSAWRPEEMKELAQPLDSSMPFEFED